MKKTDPSVEARNPLTGLDYPDPDVIRVDDTYYMVSTTMYFMPGCEILRSYDLANWEHAAYVYDRLDGTPGQTLADGENIYGKGMWAATLRHHGGRFYIVFVANDTRKTYLYTAERIEGPWKKSEIEGFYHDGSLLFDDDGRIYLAYGNRDVRLVQLRDDLSGPMPGGLSRVLVSDGDNPILGYEGTHFYKINGIYYLFFIHSLRDEWKRVEACFASDSLEGEFRGGDILNDDMGYCNQGVAQGGVVDTPEGKWYAVLFQDRGAVGRIPVLVPLVWKDGFPVPGTDGRVPESFPVSSTRPEHEYEPLVRSDDFRVPELSELPAEEAARRYGCFGLRSAWQFNHEPEPTLVDWKKERGELWLQTGQLSGSVVQARNTLTQRMRYPRCAAEVTVDASRLKEGDCAGLCALQGCYGFVGIRKRRGKMYLVMVSREPEDGSESAETEREWAAVPTEESRVRLRLEADFTEMKDEARFFYENAGRWEPIGIPHRLRFRLDHFTGCRFGLFVYAAEEIGGAAGFLEFRYDF
ncbi:MAG: family 43 glycosylhydrolase [Lachnospiraceae bacterium]|nr:family 43 glycosylhydrolase [Lachnospiraceae bacterium]